MINNEILLRRKNMLMVEVVENILDVSIEENKIEQQKRDAAIASISKNISSFGYILDMDILNTLKNTTYDEIINWYFSVRDIIKDVIGLREHMDPLYKNFPEDVMSTNESEMYLASLVYYLSNNTVSPAEEVARPELKEFTNLIRISKGSEEIFNNIFTNLLSSKVSFGEVEKVDVAYFVLHNEKFADLLPEVIPNKENLITLTNNCIDNFGFDDKRTIALTKVYKTSTDVLRLAVAMSNGDISLSSKIQYKKFNRLERRFLLSLLDNIKYPLEDMNRYKSQWISLGEIIHPGEYKNRYSNAFNNFTKLRNNTKIKTFNGKVNIAIESKDLNSLLKLLSKRPGEFARMVDRCLVNFNSLNDSNKILDEFEKVVDNVETTVIISLMEHMKDRLGEIDSRIFFPKGKLSKAYFKENDLKEIDETIIKRTIAICEQGLINIYKNKEPMGKVYIDECLKDFKFPTVLRNTSRTLQYKARGSKLPLEPNCNVVRTFLYWKEVPKQGDVDLDLSVIVLDSDFKIVKTCYYGNLSNNDVKSFGLYHSGDIRKAPKGAAEYVDLDLDKIKSNGGVYALVCAHSFTQQPFYQLDEAFIGYMERENPNDGKIFEPTTVSTKSDLITEQITSVSMIIDVVNREMTWLDLGADVHHVDGVCNNIHSNKGNIVPMIKSFLQRNIASIYDIIALNVKARGELIDDKANADYIFSLEGYVEPELEEPTSVECSILEEEDEQETIKPEEDINSEEIVEEIIEPPKRILITPYDVDTLLGQYL